MKFEQCRDELLAILDRFHRIVNHQNKVAVIKGTTQNAVDEILPLFCANRFEHAAMAMQLINDFDFDLPYKDINPFRGYVITALVEFMGKSIDGMNAEYDNVKAEITAKYGAK